MGKTDSGEIAEAIQTLARRMRRFSAHHGDHVNRLDRLRLLLLDNDAISMRDLASLLDIRPPSLSQWLDRLVEEGEVTKQRDEDDKRVVRISLTEKGLKLARVSKGKAEQSEGMFSGCLTDEEARSFLEGCQKLYAHLSKADDRTGATGEDFGWPHHLRGSRAVHHRNHRQQRPSGSGPDKPCDCKRAERDGAKNQEGSYGEV